MRWRIKGYKYLVFADPVCSVKLKDPVRNKNE